MRYLVTILATAIIAAGSAIYIHEQYFDQPDLVRVEGTRWCFYGEYNSLDAYELTSRPPEAFLSLGSRGQISVYVPCESIKSGIMYSEYEQEK